MPETLARTIDHARAADGLSSQVNLSKTLSMLKEVQEGNHHLCRCSGYPNGSCAVPGELWSRKRQDRMSCPVPMPSSAVIVAGMIRATTMALS